MPPALVAPDRAAAERLAARLGLHGAVLEAGPVTQQAAAAFLRDLARLRPPPRPKGAMLIGKRRGRAPGVQEARDGRQDPRPGRP